MKPHIVLFVVECATPLALAVLQPRHRNQRHACHSHWPPISSPAAVLARSDLGFNNIGYHNAEYRTPTLDALARDGVTLEGFYAYHVCAPSRGSLLTGRYGWRLSPSL